MLNRDARETSSLISGSRSRELGGSDQIGLEGSGAEPGSTAGSVSLPAKAEF